MAANAVTNSGRKNEYRCTGRVDAVLIAIVRRADACPSLPIAHHRFFAPQQHPRRQYTGISNAPKPVYLPAMPNQCVRS